MWERVLSRKRDSSFAKEAVDRTTALGYGVVSGGAKGIDTISGVQALMNGAKVIEYLSDSMLKKAGKKVILCGISRMENCC